MPWRVHHRIGRVERCPGTCRFVFVALFVPHCDRYSGPVGSRRRERDARRPARTASDINLRSFLTLSLRARLQINAPNAESYYSVRRAKNSKNGFFKNLAVITAGVNFFLSPAILSGTPSPKLPIPPEIGPIGARKRSDLGKEGNTVVRVWSVTAVADDAACSIACRIEISRDCCHNVPEHRRYRILCRHL